MRVADLTQKVEQNLQDLAKQVEDLKVQVSKLKKAKGLWSCRDCHCS
jgi:hypothetical protein